MPARPRMKRFQAWVRTRMQWVRNSQRTPCSAPDHSYLIDSSSRKVRRQIWINRWILYSGCFATTNDNLHPKAGSRLEPQRCRLPQTAEWQRHRAGCHKVCTAPDPTQLQICSRAPLRWHCEIRWTNKQTKILIHISECSGTKHALLDKARCK